MSAGQTGALQEDKVDKYVRELREIQEYDKVKEFLEEHFGKLENEKEVDFPELKKNLYFQTDDEKVEIWVYKNDKQYFSKGWKLIKAD